MFNVIKNNQQILLLFLSVFTSLSLFGKEKKQVISSPDGHVKLHFWVSDEGNAYYSVDYKEKPVLEPSSLGIEAESIDLASHLSFLKSSPVKLVSDDYESLNAKRRLNAYKANQQVFYLQNAKKQAINIRFQVSNDGVVFRYEIPQIDQSARQLTKEKTSYKFSNSIKAWLQPVAIAKSGWEQTNPSYEEHYYENIQVGTPEPTQTGWVYPALFQADDVWVLITETGLQRNHGATRLHPESVNGEYKLSYADPREVIFEGALLTSIQGDFFTPWRVITVGDLGTIVESTLGLDIAEAGIPLDQSFIKPGKSSWSWINSKDDFIVYDEQKKYIDFAADMNWQYCLIDVNWDRNIGYEKIQELADYAKAKNVGLLLWYNSAGDWNTVGYTPKNKLLTAEQRTEEFKKIQAMGIKGVKIDFFGGDGRSVIDYYIDILEDAAKHNLLVNFHGATLPRGWSRKYPHLMTVEAVRGFENVTFTQEEADKQAKICAILPFTRNVFDPMDYTPMNLYKVNSNVKRRTTPAFELATSVLFLSGIQHYAESPEGMTHVPEYIRTFLRELPVSWDNVKFIEGFPGKEVVIARKSGEKWYVAGINGEQMEKTLKLDLSSLQSKGKITLIADAEKAGDFTTSEIALKDPLSISMKSNGGFVMVIQ
ncbi:glycoside hydrolase family 97 protein [Sphingobacterium hungaricum]